MSNRKRTTLNGKIRIKHGFPFKSEFFESSGDFVVLTPGNFFEEGGFKMNEGKDKFYSASYPAEYLLRKGDLLIAMTEQTEGLLGSMAIIPESNKFLHNQRLGLVTSDSREIFLEFLYHLFKTKWIREQIRLTSTGSKVKHTSPDRLYDVEVELPEVSTQKKIVEVLSTLDAKIELNHRINEELEGMAKLLYDYWFVQFDFPISAAQAAAMDAPRLEGKPYRASGGKMVYNQSLKREIPEGWEAGNLEHLGEVVGGSTPSTHQSDFFTKDGTPWITPKDLSGNKGNRFVDHGATDVTEHGIKAASLKILPAGTVLLSSRAPIGYLAIARKPVTTNQGFKSFLPSKDFSTDYVYFTLNHFMKLIKANASGSTFKEISGGTLKAVRIHFPPFELAGKFSGTASVLSKQRSILEQQNQHLTELRDWLLPMLMNGQVTVGKRNRKKKT